MEDNHHHILSNLYGFNGPSDFITSLFAIKWVKASIFGSIIAGVMSYFTDLFTFGTEQLLVMWFLMLLDTITGAYYAKVQKNFSSRKFMRTPILMFVNSVIIMVVLMMAKAIPAFFFHLPNVMFGWFFVGYFFSLLENLSNLNLFPGKLITHLKKNFGMKNINTKALRGVNDDPEDEYDSRN